MNRCKCKICKVYVHGASYVKHLRSKKHLENEKQKEITIPECLFQEPIEKKIKKFYNHKPFRQRARDNIKSNDK